MVDILSLEGIDQNTTPILFDKVELAKSDQTANRYPGLIFSNDVDSNLAQASYLAASNILNDRPKPQIKISL